MSIYQRLFKYRERSSRSPREDFLSEALVDLLNRIPKQELLLLIDKLFIRKDRDKKRWETHLKNYPNASLSWYTQRAIEFENARARLDIVLCDENHDVLLIVENKINAVHQKHAISDLGPSLEAQQEYRSQLVTYGRWLLSHRAGNEWDGALVLLTHATLAPEGFADGSALYGVSCQSVLKWSEVWSWLRQYQQSGVMDKASLQNEARARFTLASELAELLEEWEMNAEVITQFDLAAAEIFAQSSARVGETFARIRPRVLRALDGLSSYAHDTWDFDSDGAVVADSIFITEPQERKNKTWYAAWGVRFPTKSRWWNELEPALPASNHAYVCIRNERKGFPGFRKLTPLIPVDWLEATSGAEIVIGQSLSCFPQTPDEMTEAMGSWMALKLDEIKPALLDIQGKKW